MGTSLMEEILIYNIVFWSVWILLSALPQIVVQHIIDNHETFFKKNEKNC